jgi:anion-transporting  ArsA/GET3 family ATPase
MQQGFADRAADVQQLLADPATGFVLVTSPTLDAIEELSWFAGHLSSRGISPSAAIVNRCHPSFLTDATLLGNAESALATSSRPFRAQLQILVDAEHDSRHDAILIEELERSFPELVVDTVSLSAAPARDLTELARIAGELGGGTRREATMA